MLEPGDAFDGSFEQWYRMAMGEGGLPEDESNSIARCSICRGPLCGRDWTNHTIGFIHPGCITSADELQKRREIIEKRGFGPDGHLNSDAFVGPGGNWEEKLNPPASRRMNDGRNGAL